MSYVWRSHVTHMNETCHKHEWVMSRIQIQYTTRGLFHTWDMTHSYVWHDSFICGIWLYSCVGHDSFMCVTWLIRMFDRTCVTYTYHVNTLQHTATHPHHAATHCNTVQHTATRCNMLQHAACNTATHAHVWRIHTMWTHCNTLQHTATRPHHAARHCNTLQHTATHCNTLQHTATHCNTYTCVAYTYHVNTLQHTATHYNTYTCVTYSYRARRRD